jgi:hypothetical protein
VFLFKKDCSAATEDEARSLLAPFGPIELCAATTGVARELQDHGKIPAMYVKFAYYLDCRDALKVSLLPPLSSLGEPPFSDRDPGL